MSISRKSWLPLANWLIGYAAAVMIVLPLLLPMLDGFTHSDRSHGVPLEDMQANNIPLSEFPISTLLGTAVWLLHPNLHLYTTYTLALGASAAAWCILPALLSRAKWRGLEVVTLLLLLFGVLLIVPAPADLADYDSSSALSLHALAVSRIRPIPIFPAPLPAHPPAGMSFPARRALAICGTCVFAIPLVLFPCRPRSIP